MLSCCLNLYYLVVDFLATPMLHSFTFVANRSEQRDSWKQDASGDMLTNINLEHEEELVTGNKEMTRQPHSRLAVPTKRILQQIGKLGVPMKTDRW